MLNVTSFSGIYIIFSNFSLDKFCIALVEPPIVRCSDEERLGRVKTRNSFQFAIFGQKVGNHAGGLCAQAEADDVNVVECEESTIEQ